MKRLNWKAITSATIALLAFATVSGCVMERDHGPYTWDHGDRIDRYGHRERALSLAQHTDGSN